jgi:hypothetical protein
VGGGFGNALPCGDVPVRLPGVTMMLTAGAPRVPMRRGGMRRQGLVWALLLGASAAARAQVRVERAWRVAGPFAAGKAERAVDVVGAEQWAGGGGPPALAGTLPSEFVRGGRVGWQSVQAAESGVVDLQALAGNQAAFAWGLGQLSVGTRGCVSLRVSGAVVRAWVGNGTNIPLHRAGRQTTLEAGWHAITVKAGSGGGGGLMFAVYAAPCPTAKAELRMLRMLPGDWEVGAGKWEEGPPAYDLPDLVDNRLFSEIINARVKNSGGTFLKGVRLHVQPSSILAASSSPHLVSLAPGQRITLYAPLRTHSHNVSQPLADEVCPLGVTLAVTAESAAWPDQAEAPQAPGKASLVQATMTFRLRCRKIDESFLFTFVDADGSPQSAGARQVLHQHSRREARAAPAF